MNMRHETLGQFLLSLLHSYGVEHAYGVDGDAVIRIRKEFDTFGKITNVTCAHESTAAFSAEAYGRVKRLGFLYVTYNAGINNALNGIDEGYLHNSALVVIGGEPSMKFRSANPCLHHHQLRFGEFNDQKNLLAVKLGADRVASITDITTAAEIIAVMVGKAVKNRLPVYLGIPSDMWDKEISYYEDEIEMIRFQYDSNQPELTKSDFAAILNVLQQTLTKMKHPIISVGHEVKEFGLLPETIRFSGKLKLPVVARFNGYGTFPVDHPLFVGTYNGPASVPPNIREFTENAERIDIGVLETDLNFALQTETVKLPPAVITFDPREGYVTIGKQLQARCNPKEQSLLLKRLAETMTPHAPHACTPFVSWVKERDDANWRMSQIHKTEEENIQISDIAPMLNDFLKDKDMPIVADVGDAMFIALGILPSLPSRITYTSVFAAMGVFAGCIGLEHSTGKRPLVLVGDGAFCMGETYSLMLAGAKPVIIILNNGGWSMMRQLRGENAAAARKDTDPLLWPPTMKFGVDYIARTRQELETGLFNASVVDAPFIIDLRLMTDDKSEPLKNFKDVRR
jgi:indolepyruvate decarboxylase